MDISNEDYEKIIETDDLRKLIWLAMCNRQPGLENVPEAFGGSSAEFFRHQCKNYSVTYEIETTLHSYIDKRYDDSKPLKKGEITRLITIAYEMQSSYWHDIFLTYMRKALEELLARLELEKIRRKRSKKSSKLEENIIETLKRSDFDEGYIQEYKLTGIFPGATEKIKRFKFPDQWELIEEK